MKTTIRGGTTNMIGRCNAGSKNISAQSTALQLLRSIQLSGRRHAQSARQRRISITPTRFPITPAKRHFRIRHQHKTVLFVCRLHRAALAFASAGGRRSPNIGDVYKAGWDKIRQRATTN